MTDNRLQLEKTWSALREQVERALESCIQQLSPDCPDRLSESMAYSLLAGGKRLRPVLVLMACQACGGSLEAALPAACAVEMVHTYSLIHDDLPAMDDDNLRRGRPTNHVQFDDGTAVLAGDGLLTWAFELLASELEPKTAARCCRLLARAAGPAGMVGGQMADLEAENQELDSLEQLESIHRRKTGCLLTASVQLGAVIAGAPDETLEALQEYGLRVGLAFQIADDLLDLVGEPDKMGKDVRKDSAHGKLTYPSLLGVDPSRERARQLIDSACERIRILGDQGQCLDALARFVIERDH